MGLIGRMITGRGLRQVSGAVTDVAEVFRPNATRKMELGHEAFVASVGQHSAEFQYGGARFFDRLINGLNRLPRPMLALGTLGLFVFAMVDPLLFAERMEGLAYVPDPLWWLLGAIVSFYFGARELHYRRSSQPPAKPKPRRDRAAPAPQTPRNKPQRKEVHAYKTGPNAALDAWNNERDG